MGDPVVATAWHREFVGLVNGLRRSRGLGEVAIEARLQAAAAFRAGDMLRRNYFAHETPGRGRPIDVARSFGYEPAPSGYAVGEIILWGDPSGDGEVSPRDAFLVWRDSPDHHAVMVTPQFVAVGVGGPAGAAGKGPLWGVCCAIFGNVVGTGSPTQPGHPAVPAEGEQPRRRLRLPAEKPPRDREGRGERREAGRAAGPKGMGRRLRRAVGGVLPWAG